MFKMKKIIKISIIFIIIFVFTFSSLKTTNIVTTMKESDKRIALTFDDGPSRKNTAVLLDALKERNVKATFFVLGLNVVKYPDLVKRMVDEGHEVGNHTYSHKNLFQLDDDEIKEEIDITNNLIKDITGSNPKIFRPSYGNYNENIKNIANMEVVNWTIDSLDWRLKNTKKIYNRVIYKLKGNDIVLLHDIYKTSVNAAIKIIDKLQAEGYEFVTISEILGLNNEPEIIGP